jgi:GNAT superfamily N-acetyltransferase
LGRFRRHCVLRNYASDKYEKQQAMNPFHLGPPKRPQAASRCTGFCRIIWREGFYTLGKKLVGNRLVKGVSLLKIRVAELTDAPAIVGVINAAFRKAESFLIDRDRIDLKSVEDLLRKGKFLLAHDGGVIIGCVYVEMRGDRSYLGLLSVDPQGQKAGLGSLLMTAAEEYCRNAGSRVMDLRIVNVRQELPRFYHRLGYTENGTEPFTAGLNPKVPCHFVNMSKPLG